MNIGYSDIIDTVPWHCGDKDCPVGWHLSNYWIQDDGEFTVDNYGDGDHDPIDPEDMPSPEESREAWRAYFKDVLLTGEDPLGEFFTITESKKVRERWQIWLVPTIAGTLVRKIRHAGREYKAAELPSHVLSFLNIDPNGHRMMLRDFKEPCDLPDGMKFYRWETVHITAKVPRSPQTVARELRVAARKALKQFQKEAA